jgi:TIR domain
MPEWLWGKSMAVFVSYRREDSAPYALSIAQYLEKHLGARNVFIDIDKIRPGVDFHDALDEALTQCTVVLVVIGPQWTTSKNQLGQLRLHTSQDWVRIEVLSAIRRNIRLLPILVGGASPPRSEDLPDELQQISRLQCAAVSHSGFRVEMASLLRDLRGNRAARRATWLRRNLIASFALSGALALLGGIAYVASNQFVPPYDSTSKINLDDFAADFRVRFAVARNAGDLETLIRDLFAAMRVGKAVDLQTHIELIQHSVQKFRLMSPVIGSERIPCSTKAECQIKYEERGKEISRRRAAINANAQAQSKGNPRDFEYALTEALAVDSYFSDESIWQALLSLKKKEVAFREGAVWP